MQWRHNVTETYVTSCCGETCVGIYACIYILLALKCITGFSHIPLLVQQPMAGVLWAVPKLTGRNVAAFFYNPLSMFS